MSTALRTKFRSFVNSYNTFRSSWQSCTPPETTGKILKESQKISSLEFPWQGYHVTQLNRVEKQIEKGEFENRQKKIYFWPFLKLPYQKTPLRFGGITQGSGCWTAEDPVILKIASNIVPNWDSEYGFPFIINLDGNPNKKIIIQKAWECNPEWIQYLRQGKPWYNIQNKIIHCTNLAIKALNNPEDKTLSKKHT